MTDIFPRTCRGCQERFCAPRGTLYCSAECHIQANTIADGDCRVWTGKRHMRGGKLWANITHRKQTHHLRIFIGAMAGLERTDEQTPEATCGTPLCCNPDHYGLRDRLRKKTIQKAGK